jgi:allene oxide cyclase-like protein
MKRLLKVAVPAAATAAVLAAMVAWASPSHHGGGKTVTVIEHATTDATTDTGAAGDSAGDVLTFANEVFNAGDTKKVGTDQGYCIRAVAGASYECNWTTLLPGGQITVEGPFYDTKDSTLAITGGTGRYRNARGTMDLRSRENGTKFAFVFHLVG